ncbi:PR-1-like protein [Ascodesmis nigricans]|uniref:PR-1-like protein n=1 Tax=Ascodesmis nigricans TaxID=341454 RepID=A0A4S2N3T2_9PEZI|nr:PR-1-like protein [Ascodesmis nigricans]
MFISVTAGGRPVTIPVNDVQKEAQPTAISGSGKNTNSNVQDWIDKIRKDYEDRHNRPKRPTTPTVAPPAITSPPVVSDPVETPIIIENPDEPKEEEKEEEIPKEETPKEETPEEETPKEETPKEETPKEETPKEEEKEEEQAGGSSGLGVFAQTALDMHNKYRRKHSANDLVWDEGLAATAMKWATTNGCKMQHSDRSFRNNAGENLYAKGGKKSSDLVDGTNVDPSEGITGWYNEWKSYTGDYSVSDGVGHFTQVVWKATTKLGCAMPICNMPGLGSNTGFLVCHYSVAGNMMGQFSQNVQGTPSS